MLSNCSRGVLLLLVATLTTYAQCYGACSIGYGSVTPPSSSCHHKPPQDAGCRNSHAVFTEGAAKAYAAPVLSISDGAGSYQVLAPPAPLEFAPVLSGAPPGGSIVPVSSVLRI